ncbi:uncharacterized protein LOC143020443 [Oratosquilla oratoria]|uniref:uncharacterized protein LOC143020443 n=1 Tax=Oratosquilla oratoria TaxID=337810 RepID=UPI003F765318
MFNLENFVKAPSAEEVRKLNKPELEMIAHHYQISECSGLNKNPLKDKILEYLEENKLILALREDVGGASPVNDLALQVELKKLELEIERLKSQSHGIEKTPNIPKFNEDEPDKFFSIFEKLARMYQWSFSQWTQMVYGALSGKALDTFIALSESQSSDYYVLKYNILQAYQLVPEAYRQQFRKCRKSNQETYVEYFQRKLRLFTQWVESEEAHVDLEKLKGLILMEDIRNNIPPDVRANLDQRGIRTLAEAGPAADYYHLTNPRMHSRSHPTLPQSSPPPPLGTPSQSDLHRLLDRRLTHHLLHLPQVSPLIVRPGNLPSLEAGAIASIAKDQDIMLMNVSNYNKERLLSKVALDQDSPPTSIKLLRDTGSALSLITKYVAALINVCYTGNWVLVNGLTGGSRIPICQVYLRSDIRTGYAQVGVVDKLPVEGVSLLIGNDLAGGTMLPNVIVSSCPSAENNTFQLEADIPGIFPACAVTRSMSHRVEAEISEHNEDAHAGVITPQPSENTEDVPTQPDLADLNLDILMRKFRPTDSPANYPWSVRHQIMVPSPLRKEILGIAHDGVAGKPHPSVKPFPLQPIPVIEEPFGRIVIDCVGPLPKTPRGNQFLFTMIDCATRYPEAIPLRRITAKNVVRALIQFFTQLIYGHEVRGPLKALKESWLLENSVTPLVSYVVEFREKLKAAVRLANAHLKSAQIEMKQQSDKKHKVEHREFRVGDKVLVFLPVQTHPFQARYDGPFQIVDRVGDANYVVYTPGRRKKKRLVHVNLLKPYRVRKSKEREENVEPSLPACVVVPTCNYDQKDNLPELQSGLYAKVDNSTILYDPSTKLGHLSNDQASDISSLLTDYSDIFSDHPHPCSAVEHDIETNGARPIRQRPYRLNAFKKEYVREEVQRLQEVGIVEPSSSPWASPVVLVPKPDGSMRLCIDYRKLNAVTEPDSYPLPRIDDVIDEVGRAQWVTKLDLLQGYSQVRLSERSRAISAFITPEGLYLFTVLPFGLRNAPATFQRLMNIVTAGLVGVHCHLDDLVVFSDSWGEHVDRPRALFAVLAAHSLTVNLAKSEFGHARITFLGHVVGKGEVQPIAAKITAILQYPAPSDKKGVMRLLGMVGYYRRFCPNFSSVVAPLTDLLSTKTYFKWTQACQDSFESRSWCLQEGEEDRVLHPVCYFSKKFLKAQRNYATIGKEALALIMSMEAFRVYVGSTVHPVQVFTDHNPLTFVERMKNTNQRLLRWALALQPFNLQIAHISGKNNVLADALSRTTHV